MGKSQKRNQIKLDYMKNFLKTNYFKLLTSVSLLFFSLSLFMFSVSRLNANDLQYVKETKVVNPGEVHVAGVGIKDDYAYIIDYAVDGRNTYYKIPLSRFKYSSDSGVDAP